MPVYATPEQVADYVRVPTGQTLPIGDDLDALIARAERDIDSLPLQYTLDERDPATGLRYDPTVLETYRAQALARAVAAQIEFGLTPQGQAAGSGIKTASGPDFSITYAEVGTGAADRTISPRAKQELRSGGLLRAWAHVR